MQPASDMPEYMEIFRNPLHNKYKRLPLMKCQSGGICRSICINKERE